MQAFPSLERISTQKKKALICLGNINSEIQIQIQIKTTNSPESSTCNKPETNKSIENQ